MSFGAFYENCLQYYFIVYSMVTIHQYTFYISIQAVVHPTALHSVYPMFWAIFAPMCGQCAAAVHTWHRECAVGSWKCV